MKGNSDAQQHNQPSAPPIDSASNEVIAHHQPHQQMQHQLQQIQRETVSLLQSPAPPPTSSTPNAGGGTAMPDLPPPSYNEAITGAYPSIPAPLPGYAPYQPNTFPKAPGSEQYPAPYPQHPQHYNAIGGGAAPAANVYHPTTNVPYNTTHIIHETTIIPGIGNCIHCTTGRVESETDLCCLLCLILLAIFTFPIGLVLLCCIPCTVRKRCTRCRRLN